MSSKRSPQTTDVKVSKSAKTMASEAAMKFVNQPESQCNALLAMDTTGIMSQAKITRRQPGPKDVAIKILFAGMCHSDVHQLHGDWGNSNFPMVPGHEIYGVVSAVGSDVTQFKEGQRVGVGCMVDSCRSCVNCSRNKEQYCRKSPAFTYNSELPSGELTFGGYSDSIVVTEHFVCPIPESVPDEKAAPLLCAGITMYSPLNRFGFIENGAGKTVAVAGFGGLGQMGVKLAKAAGAEVIVLSRNYNKKATAEALGARIIAYDDEEAMAAAAGSVDILLDTIACHHDISKFVPLMVAEGIINRLGAYVQPLELQISTLFAGLNVSASLIGGIQETNEMLEFCGKHGVFPEVEVIPASRANVAIKALAAGHGPAGDAGRFVIDVQGSLTDNAIEMEPVEV